MLMAGLECVCGVSCGNATRRKVGDEARIINVGPIPTLAHLGCSPYPQPENVLVNPLDGEPPTGEPDAGEPHVRFGGRGGANLCAFPTPICSVSCQETRPPRQAH